MKRIGVVIGVLLLASAPALAEQYYWGEIGPGGVVWVEGYGDWGEIGFYRGDYYVHVYGLGDWIWIERDGDIWVEDRHWGSLNEYGDVIQDEDGYLFTIEYDPFYGDFAYDGVFAWDPETVFFVLAFEEKFFGWEVGLFDVLDFNQPPVARIRHAKGGSVSRVAFTLDAVDLDGEIRNVVWDFGDGTTSTEFDPVHDYGRYGYFEVRVTVWDDGGEPASARAFVTLKSRPPKARFRKKKVKSVPGAVYFKDRSKDRNGVVVAWHWDFGDGHESTEQFPTHVYLAPGRYTVTLTVTDDDGETGTRLKGVRIR